MEADEGNLGHARSIFERGLAIDYTYVPLWHRYAQVEAKAHQFDSATAVLDRATSLLPLESKLWLEYLEYEEIRGNTQKCDQIFRKWSATGSHDAWKPWYLFKKRTNIKNDEDRGTLVEQWIKSVPESVDAWKALLADAGAQSSQETFARFLEDGTLDVGESNKLIKKLPLLQADARDTALESIKSDALIEKSIQQNGSDVGLWWGSVNIHREASYNLLSEAVTRCRRPASYTGSRKTLEMRMYALLWLRYALTTEYRESRASAVQVYEQALQNWDHSRVTSVTLWSNYSYCYLRDGRLDLCRKVFGSAISKTRLNSEGNIHILRNYIDLERKLLETERVRRLYNVLCSQWPQNTSSWVSYAQFESALDEYERARFIYKLALSLQVEQDDGDTLWKAYAELVADHDPEQARDIWEQAVRSGNDKADIYTEYAMFEISTGLGDDSDLPDSDTVTRARNIFERGLNELKESGVDDELGQYRQLFDLYLQFEEAYGNEETLIRLQARLPQAPEKVDSEMETESGSETDTHAASNASDSSSISESESGSESESESNAGASNSGASTEAGKLLPNASAIQRLLDNAHKWKKSQE